ncbi:MAG: hypothetical protein IJC43_10670 [Clostridia bacterium]|nr:hypothetical protein [Clostridia bacterium]
MLLPKAGGKITFFRLPSMSFMANSAFLTSSPPPAGAALFIVKVEADFKSRRFL